MDEELSKSLNSIINHLGRIADSLEGIAKSLRRMQPREPHHPVYHTGKGKTIAELEREVFGARHTVGDVIDADG